VHKVLNSGVNSSLFLVPRNCVQKNSVMNPPDRKTANWLNLMQQSIRCTA